MVLSVETFGIMLISTEAATKLNWNYKKRFFKALLVIGNEPYWKVDYHYIKLNIQTQRSS